MPDMTGKSEALQEPHVFRAVLTPNRSLSRSGFLVLMALLGLVSFVAGVVFAVIGAWPVFGFFGLDLALVYGAFQLNYRSGRAFEVVELTRDVLRLTRVDARGRPQAREVNPYWARVVLREWPDGRAELKIATHGRELAFGHVLNHDERREFAGVLSAELVKLRAG